MMDYELTTIASAGVCGIMRTVALTSLQSFNEYICESLST